MYDCEYILDEYYDYELFLLYIAKYANKQKDTED